MSAKSDSKKPDPVKSDLIKTRTPVSKYYKIEGTTIKRLKKECPRCGKGYFLANHSNRQTCGKCNYTQFNK